ncbi:MAG: sugar phosphate isomerase/epimerase family protein [Candidatus Brachytrichaceae bacterium NZ_4S206]|jgi:sugar phosphate isomerase/epimerase
MKITLTSWSFPRCTLAEAAGIARALGFAAMDVGAYPGGHLDRDAILRGDRAEVQRVHALGLQISNVYYTFGAGFVERPLNSPDPDVRRRNLEDFRRVIEFCATIACPSVMLLPGVIHPGMSKADAIQRCIEASQELLAISQQAGIEIALEPHVMGLLESPRDTLAVLEGAPGLKLALDYAHFITLGYTQADVDPLCAFAAHVHLRQAKPGFLQTRLEHGTLNFPAMLDALRQANYAGYLAVEYVHQDYMQTDNVDVISETVKMRDLVRASLG